MLARVFKNDRIVVLTDPKEIRAAVESPDPVWIELEREAPECNQLLLDVLHVHPLTIEDIWGKARTPKLEDYREYLYVVIHGVKSAKRGSVDTIELDVVIGKTWVLTHDSTGDITKEVVEGLERDPTLLNKGPAWLAHAILDNAVDHYLPIIDQLN
jgi:magnesium transporter